MSSFKTSLRALKEALRENETDGISPDTHQKTEGPDVLSVIQRHSEDSLESTRKLLEQDPTNRDLMDWYAFMLYSNDRCSEASDIYRRLLEADDTVAEHGYYLACCEYRLGHIEDAVSVWLRVHEIDALGTYGRKAREKVDMVYERHYPL